MHKIRHSPIVLMPIFIDTIRTPEDPLVTELTEQLYQKGKDAVEKDSAEIHEGRDQVHARILSELAKGNLVVEINDHIIMGYTVQPRDAKQVA